MQRAIVFKTHRTGVSEWLDAMISRYGQITMAELYELLRSEAVARRQRRSRPGTCSA